MLKTMTAKFSGNCSRTGQRIQRGQTIVYDTVSRTASLADPDAPAYIRDDYVSHVIDFGSGRQYYRNKAGRCEDAPCCGCCTI